MRIDRLHVEGFGHFTGLELPFSPGLNVVHGENEAGKSTLLAFIRAGLFGFGRQEARYEPESGIHGGALWLCTASGKVVGVRRTWKRSAKLEGDLQLLGAHKEPLSPSLLPELLGGAGRELFCQLFAFGLDELADFNKLAKETSVSEALFAAGMRGARRLPEVTAEWKKRSDALFGMTASAKRPLNEKLAQLRDTRDRLDALGDRPERYFELCAQKEALAQEEQDLIGAVARIRKEAQALAGLVQAAEALRQVAAAQATLVELPEALRQFPADGVLRLEELQARRRRAHGTEGEAEAALAALLAQKEALAAELLAEDVRLALAAASSRFADHAPTLRALPARKAALAARERAAQESARSLGLSLETDALLAVEAGAAAQAQLSQLGGQLGRTQDALREAERGLAHHRTRRDELTSALEENARALGSLPEVTRESLSQKRAQAQRRALLEVELGQAQANTARAKDAVDAAGARKSAVPVSAVVAVAVCALLLAAGAFVLAGPWAGLATFAIGAVGAGVLFWLRARLEKEREQERSRLQQALSEAQARTDALGQEHASLGAEAPSEEALSTLERTVQRGEALQDEQVALERRLQGLEREGAGLEEAVVRAAHARELAAAAFSSFVKARGLPEGVDAEAALKLLVGVAQAQARLRDCAAEAEAIAADEGLAQAAQQSLSDAAARAGLDVTDAPNLPARVQACLSRQEKVQTELELLQRQAQELEARHVSVKRERQETEGALASLYAAAAVPDGDEEAFRHRAAQAATRAAAEASVASLSREVEAACRLPVEKALEALDAAGGEAEARARHEAQEQQVAQTQARLAQVLTTRGEVNKELETLQTDEEAARLRADEQRLLAEIRTLATRYTKDRMGLHLLTRARQRFEQEQQPRVVQLASRHFSELTGYRYGRVFMPAEEGAGELSVVDAEGRTKKAQELSRGTKEQLYLAFRLAVVEEFCEEKAPLPLVLDDILVNFDARRAKNAVKVLARLGARHQILAFTCHGFMRELFAEAGANVVELQSRALQLAALPR